MNAGLLATGRAALAPCTPLGCVILAKTVHERLRGLNVVVVGRSTIVGRPAAQLFLKEDCTVTIAHSATKDLPAVCRGADILVVAGGPSADGQGRLGEARRDGARCRHQPRREAGRRHAARRRRRFRKRENVAGAITRFRAASAR